MICTHCDKAEVRPGRECAWCGRIAGTLPEHARETQPAPRDPRDRSPGELVFNIGDWVGVPTKGGGYLRANVTGSAWNMHDGGTVTVWIPGTWLSTWNARDVLPWDEVPEHARETEPGPVQVTESTDWRPEQGQPWRVEYLGQFPPPVRNTVGIEYTLTGKPRVTLRGDWQPSETGEAWVPSTEPEVLGEARLMRGHTVRRMRDGGAEPLDVGTFEAVTTAGKVIVRPPGDARNHRPRTGRCVVGKLESLRVKDDDGGWSEIPAEGLTWEPVGPQSTEKYERRPAPKTVTISLAPVDTHQAEKIGRQVRSAMRARIATYTWAWVEREAGKRFAAAVGTGMGRAIRQMRDMGPAPDFSDLEGELAFAEAWAFARLWQWLGAQ